MFAQRRAHAFAHVVPRAFDRDAGRRPWPVVQQHRLSAHGACRANAAGKHAPLRIRPGGVQQAVRSAQHQSHAPYLTRQYLRHGLVGAGPRLPRDLDVRGNTGTRGRIQLRQETQPVRIAIGQPHHTHHQSRDLILVLVGQRVVQAVLGLQGRVAKTGAGSQRQGGKHT